MPEILEKFIRYIEAAGVSENTRQAYQRDIRQLIIWLEARDIQDPGSVSGADLQSYAEMMEKYRFDQEIFCFRICKRLCIFQSGGGAAWPEGDPEDPECTQPE